MTNKRQLALLPAALLSGCGDTGSTDNSITNVASAASVPTHTCESIIPSIIALAVDKTPSIVKIYKPVKIGGTDQAPVCKGEALTSTGLSERYPIYFRRVVDEDGDALVEYRPEPFPETGSNEKEK
jgi:hypothetical protein